MKKLVGLLFLLLVCITVESEVTKTKQDEQEDTLDNKELTEDDVFGTPNVDDEWHDFNDMFNFDGASGKMRKSTFREKIQKAGQNMKKTVENVKEKVKNKIEGMVCPSCDYSEYIQNISVLTDSVEKCKREKSKLLSKLTLFEGDKNEKKIVSETPYIKRYVNYVLTTLHEKVAPDDVLSYTMQLSVSDAHVQALQRYKDQGSGIQDVVAALENMVVDVKLVQESPSDFDDTERSVWIRENFTFWNLVHVVTVLILAKIALGLSLHFHMRYSWLQLVARLMVLMYVASIPWCWWHLYQIEVARRHADMLKDVPSECQRESQGVLQSFISAFSFSRDECAKYHEMLLVDPMWEVPPTKALAVTTSKFLLEPLEHLGQGMSRFITAALRDLPVHLQPVVFMLTLVLITIMVIMFFGYDVHFFHLIGLRNAGQGGVIGQAGQRLQLQEAQAETERLRRDNEQLTRDMAAVEDSKQALERAIARERSEMDLVLDRMANLQIGDRPRSASPTPPLPMAAIAAVPPAAPPAAGTCEGDTAPVHQKPASAFPEPEPEPEPENDNNSASVIVLSDDEESSSNLDIQESMVVIDNSDLHFSGDRAAGDKAVTESSTNTNTSNSGDAAQIAKDGSYSDQKSIPASDVSNYDDCNNNADNDPENDDPSILAAGDSPNISEEEDDEDANPQEIGVRRTPAVTDLSSQHVPSSYRVMETLEIRQSERARVLSRERRRQQEEEAAQASREESRSYLLVSQKLDSVMGVSTGNLGTVASSTSQLSILPGEEPGVSGAMDDVPRSQLAVRQVSRGLHGSQSSTLTESMQSTRLLGQSNQISEGDDDENKNSSANPQASVCSSLDLSLSGGDFNPPDMTPETLVAAGTIPHGHNTDAAFHQIETFRGDDDVRPKQGSRPVGVSVQQDSMLGSWEDVAAVVDAAASTPGTDSDIEIIDDDPDKMYQYM